nr:gustatory receptor 25.2 [Papilio dardanus]
MNIKKHTNIEEISACIIKCMKPLLCIEYFYGIFRSRLSGRSSDPINLRMKILGMAITVIWLTLFISALAYSAISLKTVFQADDNTCFVLVGVTYAGSVINLVLHAKKNQKVIEILAGVDIALFVSVDRNVYKMSFRKCKIFFIIYILHCLACIALCFYIPGGGNKIAQFFFTLIYFERKIEMVVFCQYLYMVEQRLLLIKNYLSKLTYDRNYDMFVNNTNSKVDFNFIGHISANNYKIRELARVYSKIGKVSMLLNDIFNFFLMTALAAAFILIIIVVWSVLSEYKYMKTYVWSLPMIFYIYVELSSIILISWYCENLVAVKNVLYNLLCRITSQENLPLSMRCQANAFVNLTETWQLTINVFHMFDVNLQLILKFISICTSYLIVAIQISRLV